MKKNELSIKEALQFALNQIIEHCGLIIIIALIGVVANIIRFGALPFILGISFFISLFTYHTSYTPLSHVGWNFLTLKVLLAALLIFFIFKLIDSAYTLGFTKISLVLYDTHKAHYSLIFSCIHLAVYHFIASLLYIIIVSFGLLLFVVPGIIWAIQFWFYPYCIADKEVGPLEALKMSSRLTYGKKRELCMFFAVITLINLAAGACLVFGLIITYPLSVLASAYVFRKLQATE